MAKVGTGHWPKQVSWPCFYRRFLASVSFILSFFFVLFAWFFFLFGLSSLPPAPGHVELHINARYPEDKPPDQQTSPCSNGSSSSGLRAHWWVRSTRMVASCLVLSIQLVAIWGVGFPMHVLIKGSLLSPLASYHVGGRPLKRGLEKAIQKGGSGSFKRESTVNLEREKGETVEKKGGGTSQKKKKKVGDLRDGKKKRIQRRRVVNEKKERAGESKRGILLL